MASAKRNKNDEFYTQLTDIEKELKHYHHILKGKVIFCNCDDPTESNFWQYFARNFDFLEIKKLISTHYEPVKASYKLEITREMNEHGVVDSFVTETPLKSNGDFRSDECIEMLKESDIVITNPPFSLFREYVSQLAEFNKQFIIIGSQNAVTHKEIFKLIKNNKIWYGHSIHGNDREFKVPDDYPLHASRSRIDEEGNKYIRVTGVRWFTNVEYDQRYEDIILYKRYNKEEFPHYDNYNAININRTKDIPMDFKGVMGVPITFMDKYNPEQFEIVGCSYSYGEPVGYHHEGTSFNGIVNGENVYKRIFITNKNPVM